MIRAIVSRVVFVGSVLLGAPTWAQEHTVYGRQPFASVEIGRMQNGDPVHRQFYFAYAVAPLAGGTTKTSLCATTGANKAVKTAEEHLDQVPSYGDVHKAASAAAAEYEKTLSSKAVGEQKDLARARYQEEAKTRAAASVDAAKKLLDSLPAIAADAYQECMREAKVKPEEIPPATLIMTSSTCWKSASIGTSKCALPWLAVDKDKRAFTRVSKLLPALGDVSFGTIPMQLEVLPGPVLKQASHPVGRLLPEPSTAELSVMVAKAAELAREQGRVLDAAIAKLTPLARQDILRTPELFNFPAQAYELAQAQAEEKLNALSDEFARSRIHECVKVRGITDLQAASACAGYALDVDAFEGCLGEGFCRPTLQGSIRVEMLLSELPLTGEELLKQWAAPRMNLGKDFKAYADAGRKCRASYPKNPEAATLCLTRELAGTKEKQTIDCAVTALGKAGAAREAALQDCVASQSTTIAGLSQCLKGAKTGDLMTCAVVGGLGEEDRKKAACLFDGKKTTEEKAGCVASGDAKELWRARECLNSGKDNLGKAVCVMGDRLPKEAQDAYACAQQSSTWEAGVGCIAAQNLGGDGGRLARCAIASGGDLAGTAACAVSPGLTPEQQIALQCAMQSPDLTTFAICTGGQLTLREYIKCQEKKLGEDECFGEGNELRKFSRNVLGMDIHSDTVLGQALNLQLDMVKAQVALLEATVAALQDAGNKIGAFAQGLGDALGRAAQSFGEAARSACGDLCGNWKLSGVGAKGDIFGWEWSF